MTNKSKMSEVKMYGPVPIGKSLESNTRMVFLRNQLYVFRSSRFKKYSVIQQQENDYHETDANLAFTIPREFITRQDLTSGSLFHG